MKGWSMTSASHWVRVIEVAVELNFLRAFGRARVGKKAGRGPAGRGGGRRDGRVEEQVQKNFR